MSQPEGHPEHLDKQDERRDNPYPGPPQTSHLSGQPGLVSCCLWPSGVEVGRGAAWARPRRPQSLARPWFPASVTPPDHARARFHAGNHITACPPRQHSAWLSQDPQIITEQGENDRCACPTFNDNQFSLWLFAKDASLRTIAFCEPGRRP